MAPLDAYHSFSYNLFYAIGVIAKSCYWELSNYDGTLCPTSIRTEDNSRIPKELVAIISINQSLYKRGSFDVVLYTIVIP
jgi:hypothetical protein